MEKRIIEYSSEIRNDQSAYPHLYFLYALYFLDDYIEFLIVNNFDMSNTQTYRDVFPYFVQLYWTRGKTDLENTYNKMLDEILSLPDDHFNVIRSFYQILLEKY